MERDISAAFKISLELEGEKRISASDLFELLENIMRYGSISRASSNLGFSYRYSWGLLKEAEKALGVGLVEKQAGGYAGGGTSLAPGGRELLMQYRAFKQEVDSGLERFLSAPSPGKDISAGHAMEHTGKQLLLASTMEPVETGLLDLLEQAFFRVSGILVRHVSLGSGRALQMAREGRVDMVLTHAPRLEEEFMRQGWGKERFPLMANDFVLAGPLADPAGLQELEEEKKITAALQRIAERRAPFISRGDSSGTHLKEQELWKEAGIIPAGEWYIQSPGVAGNLGTLRLAAEKLAYALVDRATLLVSRSHEEMTVYLDKGEREAEERLQNIFVLITLSPERIPSVQEREAALFAHWATGEEGQGIISTFGQDNYSRPFFKALSRESRLP